MFKNCLATASVAVSVSFAAQAQELLTNGDFETMPLGYNMALDNNTNADGLSQTPGWTDADRIRNIVRVDGTGRYGTHGPRFDSTGMITTVSIGTPPTPTNVGHYYDAVGTATGPELTQDFVSTCARPRYSAAFSGRVGAAGIGTLTITDQAGSMLATDTLNVPTNPGNSSMNAPWLVLSGTVSLTPGTSYTLGVSIDGNTNVDDISVFCLPRIMHTKTASSSGPFVPGDVVTFVVTPTIAGTSVPPGTTLTVNDPGVPGLTLVSVSGNGWNCPGPTCSVTATNQGLPVGPMDPVTYTYVVDNDATSGMRTNCAILGEQAGPALPNTEIATPRACDTIEIRNIVEMHHYPVKYVCGFALADKPNSVGPVTSTGAFYTEINILNPDWRDADILKTVTPLVIEGEKAFREPELSGPAGDETFQIRGMTATMDDCRKLGEMMGEDDLAMRPLDIGYLSIYSTRPLDVTAVYTAMGVFEDQHNTALDVEQIEGRIVEILR